MTDAEVFKKRTQLDLETIFYKYIGSVEEDLIWEWVTGVIGKNQVQIRNNVFLVWTGRQRTLPLKVRPQDALGTTIAARADDKHPLENRFGRCSGGVYHRLEPLENVREGEVRGDVNTETT